MGWKIAVHNEDTANYEVDECEVSAWPGLVRDNRVQYRERGCRAKPAPRSGRQVPPGNQYMKTLYTVSSIKGACN